MTKLGVVMLSGLLFQTVDLSKCGKDITITGEKTQDCPEGKWIVTYDQASRELSRRCANPLFPASPVPSSSASPSSSPPASPSPTPVIPTPPGPSPSPSPVPLPSSSPSPTQSPTPGTGDCWTSCPAWPELQCPCEGTVPREWANVPPSRVGVGDKVGVNQRGQSTKFTISLSSKSQPPLCPHRGNQGECEQWIATARDQDKRGYPPIVWFAGYPRTNCNLDSVNVGDCQVEHASRSCDSDEEEEDVQNRPDVPAEQARKDCRRPNGWSLTDLEGANGGPPGYRKVCALPPNIPVLALRGVRTGFSYNDWTRRSVRGEVVWKRRPSIARRIPARGVGVASCHIFDFQRSGATLVE